MKINLNKDVLKNDASKNNKKTLYVVIVLAVLIVAVIGVYYFNYQGKLAFIPTFDFIPSSPSSTPSTPPKPSCSCEWVTTQCGGAGCTVNIFWNASWQKCICTPTGCGNSKNITCDGSPEDALICSNVQC